jgi:hypothetical protein
LDLTTGLTFWIFGGPILGGPFLSLVFDILHFFLLLLKLVYKLAEGLFSNFFGFDHWLNFFDFLGADFWEAFF